MANIFLEKIASMQAVVAAVRKSQPVSKYAAGGNGLKEYIARQLRDLQTMPLPK